MDAAFLFSAHITYAAELALLALRAFHASNTIGRTDKIRIPKISRVKFLRTTGKLPNQ